ncbi:CutA1 divalent ion tolerance protein [Gloeothece citriformis PCC 7424]|uniref:CutA1 divalent ion tolerance protein n=1 Tax=Gloeothece citriformis (strain PCC 7424) TaxID=65393 RepID=B7KCP9_GLOC7|nr:divalent-cation tolerance protein CutA [Gloeothece citriformis]ACK71600.1 CutA1 divalent ion tolerance protein [Gloeothece citriformis PCC 7424]
MTDSVTEYGIVLVTTSSQEEAEAIAFALIESVLAACVTVMPVQSIYKWQGDIYNEQEWQLIIKTKLEQFQDLSDKVIELHSYDVPEIIALPIVDGSESYLTWIGENVR